jgi:hypothetical protein
MDNSFRIPNIVLCPPSCGVKGFKIGNERLSGVGV